MTEFEKAVDYIYSYIDYEKNRNVSYNKDVYDYKRTQILLDAMGYEQTFKVAHIAGTKGKGSTTITLSKMLTASGYSVGTFISPHIESILERIAIDGNWIKENDFISIVERIKTAIEKIKTKLTAFEILNALAFYYFYEKKVDYACIEVGMGGRLDSTNIVFPSVTIITSISFDHMDKLGNTLREIAYEKAGIIKRGAPCVSAFQFDEARKIIEEKAKEENSDLYFYKKDFIAGNVENTNEYIKFDYKEGEHKSAFKSALIGGHQVENISVAYKAYRILTNNSERHLDNIKKMLLNLTIKARLTIVKDEIDIVIDGAHNAYSMECVLDSVLKWYKDINMVFAPLRDKDIKGMCEAIKKYEKNIGNIFITSPEIDCKAIDGKKVYEKVLEESLSCEYIEDFEEAVSSATKKSKYENKALLITGSLYTASGYFKIMK